MIYQIIRKVAQFHTVPSTRVQCPHSLYWNFSGSPQDVGFHVEQFLVLWLAGGWLSSFSIGNSLCTLCWLQLFDVNILGWTSKHHLFFILLSWDSSSNLPWTHRPKALFWNFLAARVVLHSGCWCKWESLIRPTLDTMGIEPLSPEPFWSTFPLGGISLFILVRYSRWVSAKKRYLTQTNAMWHGWPDRIPLVSLQTSWESEWWERNTGEAEERRALCPCLHPPTLGRSLR